MATTRAAKTTAKATKAPAKRASAPRAAPPAKTGKTPKPAAKASRTSAASKKPAKPSKPSNVSRQPTAVARADVASATADADDPLHRYRTMRDFATTAEPAGGARKQKAARVAKPLSFVVQKHAARRLHYDFRLELDGTLKSWAIPKGPSLDPSDKRMSVHVEDHPLEYASFEGVIPEKQYGAGTVIVWDRGTWLPLGDPHAGYRDGKLKFELRGEKLHGGWTLVRMKGRDERQEPWLLIKERDDAARPAAEFDITEAMPDSVLGGGTKSLPTTAKAAGKTAGGSTAKPAKAGSRGTKAAPADGKPGRIPMPAGARRAALPLTLAPQLATLVQAPPSNPGDWEYEVKFDGYRLLARVEDGDVRLFTRNGHDWTAKLKRLAAEVRSLDLPAAWLDGEIVVVGKDGGTDFQALQNAFDSERTDSIQFFVFDLPYFDGHDLRQVPLVERRALLRRLFDEQNVSAQLRFSESFEAGPDEILSAACRLRLEGLIGKRLDSPYVSSRSQSWIKLKCSERQEFVIGGFTDPQGSRSNLGALLIGIHDDNGRLVYAGKVGTGFDEATLKTVRERLEALRTDASPFEHVPPGAGKLKANWVKPKAIAEVSFGSWTRDGLVRHAVFHGLRADKSPTAIGKEKAIAPPGGASTAGTRRTAAVASGGGRSKDAVRISHADRVIDPSTGATKGDLVRYYEAVAPRMIDELRGRPLAVLRGPAGIGGELFFQKHAETFRIAGVNRLDPELWPGHPPMIEVASETGIVAAAQLNVIEFHTWNADKRYIEKPDRIIFDLDPGEGVPWEHVKEAASLVKGMLDELELVSFLKTSGGKGLHVVVPIARRLGWDPVKDFAESLVVHMARTIPQRFVSKSGPRNRVGKIFIDYLRNGRGATTVAAFSARARPGLGVSIPVEWQELPSLRGGDHWNIATAPARLEETRQADPWAGYDAVRQTLTAAIRRLGGK